MPKLPRTATKVDEVVDRTRKYTRRRGVRPREEGEVRQVRRDGRPRRSSRASIPSTPTRWSAARSSSRTAPGKRVRVLVFAKGEKEREAEAAGADFAGSDDLVAKVQRRLHGLRPRDRDARHDGRRR